MRVRSGLMLGAFWVHRLEQWDLGVHPWVCIHHKSPNHSRRVFCLWAWGLQVGRWRLTARTVARRLSDFSRTAQARKRFR